jgi:putative ABC transport system permease protein
VLLNESAVKALRLTDPLGTVLKIVTDEGEVHATVIGVLKDFNFQSLHEKIAPIIIGAWNSPFQVIDYFTLKVSGDIEKVIKAVTLVHEKFDQFTPIEYHFLDQQLESSYVAEKRASMIFRMGAGLSIFVACLGLLGLASYNIQRRTKELGIRKVFGASGLHLFLLLSSPFTKQIGVAFLIATPVAWYVMNGWLKEFEYRISLHAGFFLLAGVIALVIALASTSYSALKSGYASPLNSLRQE